MHQTKEMQRSSFEFQIALAKEYNLPVIVHSRDAMDETLEILQKYKPLTGIMHCFPGNRAAAKKVIDLGFYISFAGNVTYKKAFDLHESGAYVPLDRLLLETDAPFLSPVPVRGEKNRSEYVVHTYKFIADLRRIPLSAVTDAVTANFKGLLKN
jgi:TatD DNase family protein